MQVTRMLLWLFSSCLCSGNFTLSGPQYQKQHFCAVAQKQREYADHILEYSADSKGRRYKGRRSACTSWGVRLFSWCLSPEHTQEIIHTLLLAKKSWGCKAQSPPRINDALKLLLELCAMFINHITPQV